ncbi:site-2 protease family protein [Pyrodictium abyssi]|uniref:Site-2 protease family protein n=2 Tax=Pyrodictium abyssi TaxID=54256 RepID=A0ABM8IWY6_9CREN|nr:site-2 protease family protein [Pyrodictium abyssi]
MAGSLNVLLAYLAAWITLTTILWKLRGDKEDSRLAVSPLMVVLRIPSSFKVFDRLRNYWLLGLAFDLGIAATFLLMAEFYRLTITRIMDLVKGHVGGVAPIMPIIPGVTISIETFLYLLPGLSLAIIFHELSHALAARYEGIRVKSTGFLVALGILPAAFVEPDDEELARAPLRSRLRVYAAGILANVVLFAAITAVIMLLTKGGTYITIIDVSPGSFAEKAGIQSGDVFTSIVVNGTSFSNVPSFMNYLMKLRAENGGTLSNVTLVVVFVKPSGENVTVVKPAAPDDAADKEVYERIGIYLGDAPAFLVKSGISGSTAYSIFVVLMLASMINIGLAVINAAPLFVTDGAQMLRDIAVEKLGEDRGKLVASIISMITLAVLLPNIQL